MDYDITDQSRFILEQMYKGCIDQMTDKERKIVSSSSSLIYCLQRMQSNRRCEIMRSAEGMFIDPDSASELLLKGFIVEGSTKSVYLPSMKGLWIIEKDSFDVERLLTELERYLKQNDEEPLDENNIICLATCLVSRTYGPDAIVNLRDGSEVQDYWWDIMISVSEYLKSLDVIKKPLTHYQSKSDTEKAVSTKFRHSEKIGRRTRSIFSKNGKNGYWINVSNENHDIDVEKLAFIIAIIFGKALVTHEVTEISRWVRRFYRENMTAIAQDSFEKEYSERKVDDAIEESFAMAEEKMSEWFGE